MPVYEVIQLANGYDSSAPGYGQWFQADMLGKWTDIVIEGPMASTGLEIIVNRAGVMAETGGQAIDKYRKWLTSGKDKWSLMDGATESK